MNEEIKLIFEKEIENIDEKIKILEKDIHKKRSELKNLNTEIKKKRRISSEWFGEKIKKKKKDKEVEDVREHI